MIGMAIERDFRELTPATQAELRRIAVALVRAGKTRIEAAEAVGVNRRFVGQWVKAAEQAGEAALAGRRRGRRPGEQKALSAAQEEGLGSLIIRWCPDRLGLSFALWTRQAVRALMARETGVWLTLPVVGRYLRAWGFTAQRPMRRATERQDEAVRVWLESTYPRLPAKPGHKAAKSTGPTRPVCPIRPIMAAALLPKGTPRSFDDRPGASRSR
jgi:transposase